MCIDYESGYTAFNKDLLSSGACPFKATCIHPRTGYKEWRDVQRRVDWFNGWAGAEINNMKDKGLVK